MKVYFGLKSQKYEIIDLTDVIDEGFQGKPLENYKNIETSEEDSTSQPNDRFGLHSVFNSTSTNDCIASISADIDVSDDGDFVVDSDELNIKFNVGGYLEIVPLTEPIRIKLKFAILNYIKENYFGHYVMGAVGRKIALDLIKGGNSCSIL